MLDPPYMKEMLARGFIRYYYEGLRRWDRHTLEGIIRPRGAKRNEVDDPEIQEVLNELEAEGLIKLYRTNDLYLEVVGADKWFAEHPYEI